MKLCLRFGCAVVRFDGIVFEAIALVNSEISACRFLIIEDVLLRKGMHSFHCILIEDEIFQNNNTRGNNYMRDSHDARTCYNYLSMIRRYYLFGFVDRPRMLQALIGLFELPEDDSVPDDEHFVEVEETPGINDYLTSRIKNVSEIKNCVSRFNIC